MKRFFARIPLAVASLVLTFPVGKLPRQSGNPKIFTGEVTDIFCGKN